MRSYRPTSRLRTYGRVSTSVLSETASTAPEDARNLARRLEVADEELNARAPVVIRRDLVIEPEDLGAAADQRGRVLEPGKLRPRIGRTASKEKRRESSSPRMRATSRVVS
jgi:hypothetical protein